MTTQARGSPPTTTDSNAINEKASTVTQEISSGKSAPDLMSSNIGLSSARP